ncbi:uncharacterized protein LY89DRAFT_742430 [Mollisia scopiformis]|uniref:Clr5 domain-containing protein n=1 Tax=Mollisia scopiformis TaxID=149040 RepID=A0A132B6V1_MOLSC|nr:uncharacterized protein LY89DRAFT_742430 [Mollisia scopiformis]KUJ08138.1 hypothetical protein LY89DRAFT_742430 [Mollisia scopiformis]
MEIHKVHIKDLYLGQNKTVDEVRYDMEMNHSFTASKTEIERQLRKWNFKKNSRHSLNTQLLKYVKVGLEEWKRLSKDTDVYFRGVKIPSPQIQKSAQRCFVSFTERNKCEYMPNTTSKPVLIIGQVPTLETPSGLVLITPSSEHYMACIKSKDLPWIYFQKQIDSLASSICLDR